jgi:2-polyprenyl-3-methyl-5-hydroxy-6-metoxy-1,4-benzoquinol methylase
VIDDTRIRPAYDGSSTAFRALEGGGWGELVNLGYYPAYALPAVALGLGPFQRLLARKSLALVEPRAGLAVLDAGCGRGYTTARLARAGCDVLGLDMLAENVRAAQAKYGSTPGARFAAADVTRLPETAAGVALADASFDAVHCLEVAFHFGAKGRADFLAESFRVLRPGGRLVLVDFIWRDAQPEAIEQLDPKRLVRDTWCFTEFEPLERYRATARALGFRERALHDWTGPVINRFQKIAQTNARIGTFGLGRLILRTFRPGYARMSAADWEFLVELMRAHDAVRRASRYVALVLEKPLGV